MPLRVTATLGTVEYDTFIHTSTSYKADLGGASPTIADATVISSKIRSWLSKVFTL